MIGITKCSVKQSEDDMADEISIPNELKELFAKYEELKAGILNRYTQLVTAVLDG